MLRSGKCKIGQPRHQPMSMVFVYESIDLTGSNFTFEARENPDEADPLLSLASVADAEVDGITASLVEDAGDIWTVVTVYASKATIESLPLSVPLGSDYSLRFSYKVDGIEHVGGLFVIEGQANHV